MRRQNNMAHHTTRMAMPFSWHAHLRLFFSSSNVMSPEYFNTRSPHRIPAKQKKRHSETMGVASQHVPGLCRVDL